MRIAFIILLVASSPRIFAQDLSAIYEKVNPAVVVIFTEAKSLSSQGGLTKTVTTGGLGSGFMISNNQLITAQHVVNVAEKVQVQFSDGEIIPAKVISGYKTADVALVELTWPKKDAATVKLGDSDKLKIGEQIFIIGAPYGLGHSLSSGYVSGIIKNRQGKNPFTQVEYIQTDAAINTGNSGGPMFNLEGEVVGVVSQILSKSGGFDGIGFAATSNLSRRLLLENKTLGGGIDTYVLTDELAKSFNLPQPSGLLVQRVVLLSPLGLLGVNGGSINAVINGENIILGGDIILSFNGIRFDLTDKALTKIAESTLGIESDDPLEITVLREGRVVTLSRK